MDWSIFRDDVWRNVDMRDDRQWRDGELQRMNVLFTFGWMD